MSNRGASRPAHSNPAPWGVAKRVRTREIGYRGFQVLNYICAHMAEHGTVPTYSMICDEIGFTDPEQVRRVVVRLECRGLLERTGQGRQPRIRLITGG